MQTTRVEGKKGGEYRIRVMIFAIMAMLLHTVIIVIHINHIITNNINAIIRHCHRPELWSRRHTIRRRRRGRPLLMLFKPCAERCLPVVESPQRMVHSSIRETDGWMVDVQNRHAGRGHRR